MNELSTVPAIRRAMTLMGQGAGPVRHRSKTSLSNSGGMADPSA
jgi:hypothetical protein